MIFKKEAKMIIFEKDFVLWVDRQVYITVIPST